MKQLAGCHMVCLYAPPLTQCLVLGNTVWGFAHLISSPATLINH